MRRPIWVLLRWVNLLVRQPREASNLHLVFSDGHTLCALLERLRPGVRLVRFRRAYTRATATANIELALTLVWSLSPQASAMPSAAQVFDGTPRDLMLRFIDQLYSIVVVRPARAKLAAALRWLDQLLAPYGAALGEATLRPPHAHLAAELRTCAALAVVLHAHLPARRVPELDSAVCWCPRSEAERQRSVRAVFAILERERLAP